MDDKIVIGGKAKLRNVIKGNTSLQNLLNGSPGVQIRAVGAKGGISNAVKEALLDCFEHVAWIDDDGQVYYQALYDALYAAELVSISAVFNQGQAVIYDSDSLDDLKQYLTVTASYDDGTSETVASTDYTLSGTLNPGTSTISVAYEGKMAYFNVTVTHMPGTVTITNTLTGCTNSNSASSATEGDSYSGTISASSGYTLTGATVSITMGGTDITSTAYNNGTISIAELTGNVVITITAVAVTLSSISAVYTQSGTVYDTDTLDSLKDDLVVTATYSDSSTETVPSADYTLSGTLAVGTSTITVTYEGKTTTFTVTVTHDPDADWDYVWKPSKGTFDAAGFTTTNSGKINYTSTGAEITGVNSTSTSAMINIPVDNTHAKVSVEYGIIFTKFTNDNNNGFGTQFTLNNNKYANFRAGCAQSASDLEHGRCRYSVGSWTWLNSPSLDKNTEYVFRIDYDANGQLVVKLDGSTILSVNIGTATNSYQNLFIGLSGGYTITSLKAMEVQ